VCKPVNGTEVSVSVFQSMDKEQPVHSIGIQLVSPLFYSSASKWEGPFRCCTGSRHAKQWLCDRAQSRPHLCLLLPVVQQVTWSVLAGNVAEMVCLITCMCWLLGQMQNTYFVNTRTVLGSAIFFNFRVNALPPYPQYYRVACPRPHGITMVSLTPSPRYYR